MTKETCATRIKKALAFRDMKQSELCNITNIPKSAMSQYVKGSFEPKQDRVYLIAKALNVSEAWLMGYDVPMSNTPVESNATIIDTKIRMVPLYESVSAGFGAYAQDVVIDYIPLPINSDFEAAETLCIRVSGDSMYPKIENGDIIVVRKQSSIDSGRVGVFLIDNEDAVVKKVEYVNGEDWLTLISFNPEYQPRKFEGRDIERVQVLGLVKQIIKTI